MMVWFKLFWVFRSSGDVLVKKILGPCGAARHPGACKIVEIGGGGGGGRVEFLEYHVGVYCIISFGYTGEPSGIIQVNVQACIIPLPLPALWRKSHDGWVDRQNERDSEPTVERSQAPLLKGFGHGGFTVVHKPNRIERIHLNSNIPSLDGDLGSYSFLNHHIGC